MYWAFGQVEAVVKVVVNHQGINVSQFSVFTGGKSSGCAGLLLMRKKLISRGPEEEDHLQTSDEKPYLKFKKTLTKQPQKICGWLIRLLINKLIDYLAGG